MRSLLCAREFAIQCNLRDRKGVQLNQLFFLIFGECMRKTAERSRKRGSSISLPFLNESYRDDVNTTTSQNDNAYMN